MRLGVKRSVARNLAAMISTLRFSTTRSRPRKKSLARNWTKLAPLVKTRTAALGIVTPLLTVVVEKLTHVVTHLASIALRDENVQASMRFAQIVSRILRSDFPSVFYKIY